MPSGAKPEAEAAPEAVAAEGPASGGPEAGSASGGPVPSQPVAAQKPGQPVGPAPSAGSASGGQPAAAQCRVSQWPASAGSARSDRCLTLSDPARGSIVYNSL